MNQDARPIHVGLASLYLSVNSESSRKTKARSIETIIDIGENARVQSMIRRKVVGHEVEGENILNQQKVKEGKPGGNQRGVTMFTKYTT